VPDDALKYVPSGEDYTLGGLAVHVTDSILHYVHVIDLMKKANYAQVRAVDEMDEAKRRRDELVANGFGGGDRAAVFAEMRSEHEQLEGQLRAMSEDEYSREAPVLYGADATEPFATKPSDVVGWLADHYDEHIQQVAELLDRYKATKG